MSERGAFPDTRQPPARGGGAGARVSLVLLGVLVVAAGSFEVGNLDIWLHARTGEWIVEHGRVPATNVLSEIHAEYPSVHDKWLFQVLAHGLLDGAGPAAVVLARLAVLLALFGMLAATARALGAGPWTSLAVLSCALLAARGRFMFRPDLLSLLLLAVVLHLLLVGRPTRGRVLLLLLLQVLWVNLHGYFLLGWVSAGVVGGAQALAAWRERRVGAPSAAASARRARGTLLLAGAMAAACLLNPAGLAGWWHPFAILADLRAHFDFYSGAIAEFTPTFAPDPRQPWDRLGFFALVAAAVPSLGWAGWRWWRAPGRAADGPDRLLAAIVPCLLLLLVFGAMSRTLRRNMAVCAVVVAPATAAALTPAVRRRTSGAAGTSAAGTGAAATGALATGAAATGAAGTGGEATGTAAAHAAAVPELPAAAARVTTAAGTDAEGANAGTAPVGVGSRRRHLPWAAAPASALALLLAAGELTDTISVHDGLLRRTGFGLSELAYPLTGIRFVAEHLPRANVFTAFRYGSTFTGLRWPEQVASTNGNTHGYPTAWLIEVMDALSGRDPLAFDRLVRAHGHEVALVPMAGPLAGRLLRDRGWTLVCLGRHEAVFVRNDAVAADWLVRHDLEAQLALGQVPPLPPSPPCGRVLGLPRACRAPTERDAAALFLQAGAVRPALDVLHRGLAVAPDDPELLAQAGLLSLRTGEEAAARELLRRSLSAGLRGPLAGQVGEALAGLAGG